MNILDEIECARDEIQKLRHEIHAHPELCYEETYTSDLIAKKLSEWDIPMHRGLGKTGIVATLRAGSSQRAIGLRADMDALPILEQNNFAHRSKHDGKMHACGHDGHSAMLLGAAHYLSKHRNFDGIVHFIFQPAEESGLGARTMIREGLFKQFPVEAVFGLHNWPGLSTGTFGLRSGPIMASSSEFEITIKGQGAHAAMPNHGQDPIFATIQLAQGLQSIITRNKNPLDAAVLSITQIHSGHTLNVIPSIARLGGTVRTFKPETLELIEKRMNDITQAIALAHECTAELSFKHESKATINSALETQLAGDVMASIVGEHNVNRQIEPTMSAEDFSFMLIEKPGCYAFIGNGTRMPPNTSSHHLGPCGLHNPHYDFNDDILTLGSTYWVKLVEAFLKTEKNQQ